VIDYAALQQAAETSRAELRAAMSETIDVYVAALDAAGEAERRYAQDPDREDLAGAAREARAALDAAREAFDRKLAAEKGQHTRRVNAAEAELTG
jgi:hypothetical protein